MIVGEIEEGGFIIMYSRILVFQIDGELLDILGRELHKHTPISETVPRGSLTDR